MDEQFESGGGMSEREPGFYWVRLRNNRDQWLVAQWWGSEGGWTDTVSDGEWDDDVHYDEIGPKAEPPGPGKVTEVGVVVASRAALESEGDVVRIIAAGPTIKPPASSCTDVFHHIMMDEPSCACGKARLVIDDKDGATRVRYKIGTEGATLMISPVG